MSNIFQNVVGERKKYNNFPLGREVLVSGQIGKLIPVMCDEVVPGDHFSLTSAFLMRFSPLSAPAMARFNVHFHSFYVPLRIITPETSRESTYEKLIKSIGKHSDEVPIMPFMYGTDAGDTDAFGIGSLSDYLGLSFNKGVTIDKRARLSIMPHLAYQRIYQDFYRRDQIEKEVVFPSNVSEVSIHDMTTGIDESSGEYPELDENQVSASVYDIFKLQTRNYERDYFTSALPEPQFGDEVTVGDAQVHWFVGGENAHGYMRANEFSLFGSNPADAGSAGAFFDTRSSGGNTLFLTEEENSNQSFNTFGHYTFEPGFGEDIASHLRANSFTINEFRLAMQLQGIKEKINRVGTRYLEIMQGIYGVRVPDARLQRPIYLGGYKTPLTIGSVMQTSETASTPQGTLTGQMSGSGSSRIAGSGYEYKEHGYLITIMSVTPRTSYYGGIPRKFLKKYPEDFYLPQFDHLGEQEISSLELFGDDISNIDNATTFGYTPRYSEYKSAFSTVHGEFRTTLDNWHVSRDFDSRPALNPDFIKAEPEDFDRIFAFQNVEGTSNEHFQCQIYLDVRAKRNMSKYSTPYTLY